MTGLNILPPKELLRFVRGIQYMDLPPPEEELVIPAKGRSTLLLPKHIEYSIDGEMAERLSIHPATVVGPHDAVIINRTSLPVRAFSVDFTPLGAVELLGIPQGELVNRGVPADELLSKAWVRELVERVNEAADVPAALSAINGLLLRVLTKAPLGPDTALVGKALTEGAPILESGQADSVQHIADRLGVSPRHVNREFHRHFGMGPRRYCLIKRIQRAMTLIAEGGVKDLSRLALELGFFDYPHFSNEFKRSALTTPREFAASLRHREHRVTAATPRSI